MRRLLFNLSLICLGVLASTAWGQFDAASSRSGLGASIPARGYETAQRDAAAGAALPAYRSVEFETVPANPIGVTAEPPPDPAPPRWNDYGNPTNVPLALPAVNYFIEGPPRGLVQHIEGQAYSRVVANPDAIWPDDEMLQTIDLHRPDGLAPIGVFGDHTLPTGRAMISYRYLQNVFADNFVGTHRVSDAFVQANFTYVPSRMLQNRQVVTLEYGVSDDFTVMATLPFQHSDLDYVQLSGSGLHTGFTNPGDITINGLYVLYRAERQQVHLNLGLSVPTGLTETLTDRPSPTIPNLPYVLRTTSGTYDILPGFTYRRQTDYWTFGLQSMGTIRTGLDTLGYKLGDQVNVTGWLARQWTEHASTSVRFNSQIWGNIWGADPRLNVTLAPTNRPDLQAGQRIDLLFGINLYRPAARIPEQRFSVEAGCPVYQSLDGPQLGLQWIINAGWTIIW